MKKKPIGIGITSFSELITEGCVYIDKTVLIRDIVKKYNKVTLFTRPRRFGKSLAISMLADFFDITKKEHNAHLFDGLTISEYPEICREYQNAYPVISLSFKETRQPDFPSSFAKLKSAILGLSGLIDDLIDKVKLNKDDTEILNKIDSGQYTPDDLVSYPRIVTKILNLYYGKEVIVLLDEYDVPIQSAYLNGFYNKMMPIVYSVMSELFKDNPFLKFGIITGCLRISKESIFTGMNNLTVNSVLTERQTEYFGFTSEETKKLLTDSGASDRIETAKAWYDGYRFGKNEVYNPWSILQYVQDAADGCENRFQTYWMNTSENELLRHFIGKNTGIRGDLEKLISGNPIEKKITERSVFNNLEKNSDSFWALLLFSGYLKPISVTSDGNNCYQLAIPNREIREVLVEMCQDWFAEKVSNTEYPDLAEKFLNGSTEAAEQQIRFLFRRSISVRDAAENFYHGILAGLLIQQSEENDDYAVISNRESGAGYSDIIIKDDLHNRAVVIEVKKAVPSSDSKEAVRTALDAALDIGEKQVKDRKYALGCLDEGYAECLCYAAAFYGKDCRVRKFDYEI